LNYSKENKYSSIIDVMFIKIVGNGPAV